MNTNAHRRRIPATPTASCCRHLDASTTATAYQVARTVAANGYCADKMAWAGHTYDVAASTDIIGWLDADKLDAAPRVAYGEGCAVVYIDQSATPYIAELPTCAICSRVDVPGLLLTKLEAAFGQLTIDQDKVAA